MLDITNMRHFVSDHDLQTSFKKSITRTDFIMRGNALG